MRLVLIALAVFPGMLCAPQIAHAQADPAPRAWGDGSFSLVERFGYLAINGAERGKSGLARGPGLELRFMMPVGWGAYYRHLAIATSNDDQADWKHSEFIAGLSRRLLAVGSPQLWSARASARFDFGVGWTQTGTHERCTQSFVPFGTDCSTGPNRPRNVQGDAFAFEARLGADIGVGPLYLGLDVGMSAFLNVTTGSNSASLPSLFLSPSGQVKLGFGLPFS
jgi:hypothetical protein